MICSLVAGQVYSPVHGATHVAGSSTVNRLEPRIVGHTCEAPSLRSCWAAQAILVLDRDFDQQQASPWRRFDGKADLIPVEFVVSRPRVTSQRPPGSPILAYGLRQMLVIHANHAASWTISLRMRTVFGVCTIWAVVVEVVGKRGGPDVEPNPTGIARQAVDVLDVVGTGAVSSPRSLTCGVPVPLHQHRATTRCPRGGGQCRHPTIRRID